MAMEGEWAIVAFGAECDIKDTKLAYKYVNAEVNLPAVLYTCNNKVSFDSIGHSPWHGYAYDQGDALLLKFHCTGDEDKARAVTVHKQREGFYHGYDYRAREISMTFLRSYRFCMTCKVWH